MRVGLTYDLRDDYLQQGWSEEATAEFDRADTIEGIENALQALGYQTDRIGNARALVERLARGERWDIVFNIAEGYFGPARESQVPALLELYQIPFTFSDSLVLAIALHKGITKRLVRSAGIPTPDFAEVRSPADIASVRLPFPLFAKPVAEGTGKGISSASRLDSSDDLTRVCRRLLRQYGQPVLVERFLPGREFTAGVVGNGRRARVIGVMEVHYRSSAQAIYSYETKKEYETRVAYEPATGPVRDQCTELTRRVWDLLGCRDAGRVDLRCDGRGRPYFLEINPLAGLNPVHSDLPILARLHGWSFESLIAEIMRHALARYGLTPPHPRRWRPVRSRATADNSEPHRLRPGTRPPTGHDNTGRESA